MSSFATGYDPSQLGVELDLDDVFKAGSGTGTTGFVEGTQDLAQRYAPFTANKLGYDTGFIASDGRDLREWFEAQPPQADLDWEALRTEGASPVLPPHEAGDLIVILAGRTTSTAPSLATGYTNVATTQMTNASGRVGFRKAVSSSESGGVWTNATACIAVVIKGGATVVDATTSTSSWPANTFTRGGNLALHLGSANGAITAHPEDTPLLNGQGTGTLFMYAGYTGLNTSSSSASLGGGSARVAFTVELQPDLPLVPPMETDVALGTTCEVPPHDAGDTLIAWAINQGANTVPTLAAGWTQLQTATGTTGDLGGAMLATKVAASSSETSGTWVNADTLSITVVKGTDGIGATAIRFHQNTGLGNFFQYPAITLQKPGQSGILCLGAFADSATGVAGPNSLQPVLVGDAMGAFGSTSAFGAWAQADVLASSSGTFAATLELKITGAALPLDGTVTVGYDAGEDGAGYNDGTTGWTAPIGGWSGSPYIKALAVNQTSWYNRTRLYTATGQQIANATQLSVTVGAANATMTWVSSGYYSVDFDVFDFYGQSGAALTVTALPVALQDFNATTLPADYTPPPPTQFNSGSVQAAAPITGQPPPIPTGDLGPTPIPDPLIVP